MNTLNRWAIAIAVCVLIAWAAADGPSDDQAAQDVEAARIEAITASTDGGTR